MKRRPIIVAALLSLLLHAAAITGILYQASRQDLPPATGSESGAVELLIVEQKGAGEEGGPASDGQPEPQPEQPPTTAGAGPDPDPPAHAPDSAGTNDVAGAQSVASEPSDAAIEVAVSDPLPTPPVPPPPSPAPAPAPALAPAETKAAASRPPPAPPAQRAQPVAPTFDLRGTDSASNAMSLGDRIIPASPDNRHRNKPPAYPAEAARRGQEGAVIVQIHVGPTGVALGADVVETSGYRLLDRAAIDAVLTWRFRPALRDGMAVPFDMKMRFVFALE